MGAEFALKNSNAHEYLAQGMHPVSLDMVIGAVINSVSRARLSLTRAYDTELGANILLSKRNWVRIHFLHPRTLL